MRHRKSNGQGSKAEARSWWVVTAFSRSGWYLRYPLFASVLGRQPDESCKRCLEIARRAEVRGRRSLWPLRRKSCCRQTWSRSQRSWWAVTAFSRSRRYPRYRLSGDSQDGGQQRPAGSALRGHATKWRRTKEIGRIIADAESTHVDLYDRMTPLVPFGKPVLGCLPTTGDVSDMRQRTEVEEVRGDEKRGA